MLKPLGVVLAMLFSLAPVMAQDVLVTYAPWATVWDRMDVVNRTTGAVISSKTLTLAGFTVDGTNGLAIDPTTGTAWVVVNNSGVRRLCTVNQGTGACTQIGQLSDVVASIAFTAAGVLYAVTGDGAAVPETLYTVNKTTAAMAFAKTLGAGFDGEAIGFNAADSMMYHLSGITVMYEKIDLVTLVITPIAHSIPNNEHGAMSYDPVTSSFFAGTTGGDIYRITPAGAATLVGNPGNDGIKGIAIIPPSNPALTTSTANLNLGSTTQGTSSTAVSFTAGGTNLTANIVITSPANVVVSLMMAAGFGPTVNLTPAGGTVAATTIYVRIQSSAPLGPVTGNITVASAGATTINVAVSGQVDPPPVPEMDVLRGAIPIADGGTDAQGTQVAAATITLNYTIQNTGTVVLNLTGTPRVAVMAGMNMQSVTVTVQPSAATVAAAGSAAFTI